MDDLIAGQPGSSEPVLRARGGVRLRQWRDDAVAFDTANSATHLLSAEAATVLGMLATEQLAPTEVHGRLLDSGLFDLDEADVWTMSETKELLGEMIRQRLLLSDPA